MMVIFITLAVFLFPTLSLAAPLEVRGITHNPLDPATDEWASTLSSISPLILLIGERTTKQVLRNMRGRSSALSLATAPLGLLSIVTSLIRFCGPQLFRSFIGYELEARTVPGIEVTRVNCGGVSAHLSEGYVVRRIESNPASRLVAVSILEGEDESLARAASRRVKAVEVFQADKRRLGMPDETASVEWCLHIISAKRDRGTTQAVVLLLAEVIGVPSGCKEAKRFRIALAKAPSLDDGEPDPNMVTVSTEPEIGYLSKNSSEKVTSTIQITEVRSNSMHKGRVVEPFWNFTFMSTFDAVSEFTTSPIRSSRPALALGLLAFVAIALLQVLALWHNNWVVSVGWVLAVAGYIGTVFGVTSATILIQSSCNRITLQTDQRDKALWNDGMVVSVKNTDSMDTTGSSFVSSPSKNQTLEAVWIKPLGLNTKLYAAAVTVTLVLAFIGHYLGLRNIQWWVSVGELCICILAAFGRSASHNRQRQFKEVKGVKLDKRCTSVGVIHTQSAKLVSNKAASAALDIRAYSPRLDQHAPTAGERLAYQIAKRCLRNAGLAERVQERTGMKMEVIRDGQRDDFRAVLATFSGGILVTEGTAFPNTRVCLAFSANCAQLGAPTGLLARTIMRQPEWTVDETFGKDIPLGSVYIFSVQSMMDWWTLSEDRNDLGDLQRNLHWPMLLINVAFFMSLLGAGANDKELLVALDTIHESLPDATDTKVIDAVVEYLLA